MFRLSCSYMGLGLGGTPLQALLGAVPPAAGREGEAGPEG